MDIEAVFKHYCGPSVLFIEAKRENPRTLTIIYTIPALDPGHKRFVIAHLRNGLETVLRQGVRRAAAVAANDAFIRTGQYDAQLKELLAGRTV